MAPEVEAATLTEWTRRRSEKKEPMDKEDDPDKDYPYEHYLYKHQAGTTA